MKFNPYRLTISLLPFLLIACAPANAPETATPTPEMASPNPASSPEAMTTTDPKAGLENLNNYLSASLTALQANDLTKAKAEFEEFDEGWENVEDGVKAKTPEGYKAIEEGMDQVKNTLVRPDKPETKKAIAALESLSQTVTTYAAKL